MKTTLLIVALLFISAACFGQSVIGTGGGQQAPTSNVYVMQDHPKHADRHDMATEHSLVGGGGVSEAHGALPLWEFGSDRVEVSLGDVARTYRAEHALVAKANIVWNGNKDGVIHLRYEGK